MSTPNVPIREDIGARLREERNRLQKSQIEVGAIGGVTNKTQGLYESGVRSPDARYLQRISDAGVDVAYVVTGLRSTPAPPAAKTPDAACKAGRSEVWVMVLEVAVDELNRRGLTLPGTKLVELVDLLADYAVSDQGEVDTALVARQIRLVA